MKRQALLAALLLAQAARAAELPPAGAPEPGDALNVGKILDSLPETPVAPPRVDIEPEITEPGPGTTFSQRRRLAFRWLAEGRTKECTALFEALLQESPADKATRLGYGSALIGAGAHGRAEKIYRDLLAEFPSEYPILNNLAWLYATATDGTVRDGRRAADLAQRALLLAPGDYHVWSTLSEAYYIQGEYERAERAAREALTLAMRFQAEERIRLEYVQQIDRCKRAAQALQILE